MRTLHIRTITAAVIIRTTGTALHIGVVITANRGGYAYRGGNGYGYRGGFVGGSRGFSGGSRGSGGSRRIWWRARGRPIVRLFFGRDPKGLHFCDKGCCARAQAIQTRERDITLPFRLTCAECIHVSAASRTSCKLPNPSQVFGSLILAGCHRARGGRGLDAPLRMARMTSRSIRFSQFSNVARPGIIHQCFQSVICQFLRFPAVRPS